MFSEISDPKKTKMADIAGDGPPNKRQKIASPALTPSGSESGKIESNMIYLLSKINFMINLSDVIEVFTYFQGLFWFGRFSLIFVFV